MARRPTLENAVMDVLWSSEDWLTPAEVQDSMVGGDTKAYTTVMTVLARLWRKGRLERQRVGRAFAYRAATRREDYAANQMSEMLRIASDRGAALSRFVDALTDEDKERLRRSLRKP